MTACDHAEAEALRRRCIARARLLWERVVRGGSCNIPAMAVMAALADVQPLAAIADRPPGDPRWFRTLVETLAEGQLDRVQVARKVNAALAAAVLRLGRPAPEAVSAAYVGVLATRFRQAIFGPRTRRACPAHNLKIDGLPGRS
jgi:hypothetical protein